MWTRSELKERAKFAFKRNYWRCVLVAFVLALITGAGSTATSSGETLDTINQVNPNVADSVDDVFEDEYYEDEEIIDEFFSNAVTNSAFVMVGTVLLFIIMIISLLFAFFVSAPLTVGGCKFFTENSYTPTSSKRIFSSFQKGKYWNTVVTMFFMKLYVILWTFVFIIPGIIKSYEYRMIPYLIADDPNMPREEAFRISKEMMNGNKMDAFILDLSFFGWQLLAAITCGIVGIFYVSPYVQATDAELFIRLRDDYFQRQYAREQSFQNQEPVC